MVIVGIFVMFPIPGESFQYFSINYIMYIKIMNVCTSKDIIKRGKVQPQNGRKHFQYIPLTKYFYSEYIKNSYKFIKEIH